MYGTFNRLKPFWSVTMNLKATAATALFAVLLPMAAHADTPGPHPEYLHALTDLRDARWNLEHRSGDTSVTFQEEKAISEVDRAQGEIIKAARDDAKNLGNHPREDANLDRHGRLRHAVELLDKAHNDLAREESNPEAKEHKRRALEHVDRAVEAARQALHDVENGH
jgi:hypothetical protein